MKETNWSTHVEWVILMGTILGGLYIFEAKFENRLQSFENRMEIQAQRSDRLYEMFIDLLKEKK
jgi:hypothetical protein